MAQRRSVIGQGLRALFAAAGGLSDKGGSHGHLRCVGIAGGAMDPVARLIRLLMGSVAVWLVVLLWAYSAPAHAIGSVAAGVNRIWTCQGSTGMSPGEACSAAMSGMDDGPDRTVTRTFQGCTQNPTDPNLYSCTASVQTCIKPQYGGGCGQATTIAASPTWQDKLSCDSTAVNVGTDAAPVCSCPLSMKPAGNKCQAYTCGAPGTYTAQTQPDVGVPNAGDGLCDGGCGLQPSGWSTGADGKIWARWPFYATGKACGGDPSPTNPKIDTGEKNMSNPAPIACGAGMCPGQVNGANVCVACSSTQVQGPSSSSSAPAGSASGADGTNTSTKTSCDGQTCTTTTTTTSSSTGQVLGQTQNQQDQKSWCQLNPTSPICKDSLWGGSCSAGFNCDGDAIQCAIARRAYDSGCKWENGDPTLTPIGQAAMNAGIQPDGHPAKNADNFSMDFSSHIDQTEYFAGACPADYTLSVAGHPVTIPFSNACPSLAMLGNVFVGLTMLAAAFIVFRS